MSALLAKAFAGAAVKFDATQLYTWANAHDGDLGKHDGSTVRAGFQALVDQGDRVVASNNPAANPVGTMDKVSNYLWADTSAVNADIDRLITWILTVSPVVIGINWYNDMFNPDPATGRLTVTGAVAGGHAICVRGVNALDPDNTYFVLRNSWGPWGAKVNPDWTIAPVGMAGDALLSRADLIRLLGEEGEAGALIDNIGAPLPPIPPAPAPDPTPVPVPVPPTPPPAPTPSPPFPPKPAPPHPAPGPVVPPAVVALVAAAFDKAKAEAMKAMGH
jgi:hypothetical protein